LPSRGFDGRTIIHNGVLNKAVVGGGHGSKFAIFGLAMAQNPQQPLLRLEDLRPYLKLLGRNWWLIVGLSVLGYTAGRLVTHRQLETHEATAEILLTQGETPSVLGMMGGGAGAMGFRGNDNVQNQLRVIQSYDLVGRVLDRIDDQVDHFLVGRLKATPVDGFGAISVDVDADAWDESNMGLPIDLFVLDAERYRLVIPAPWGGDDRVLDREFGERIDEEGMNLVVRIHPDYAVDSRRLAMAQSQHFRIQVFSREQRIEDYRKRLTASNVDRTSIIALKCQDMMPGRAVRFLDSLAATFIAYTAEAKLETSLQTEKFINSQLVEMQAITDTLERQVDYFRAQNDVLDLTLEQSQAFERLLTLENQKRLLEMQDNSLLTLEDYLRNPGTDLPPVGYLSLEDGIMVDKLGELYGLQARRSAMLLDVQPGSYQIRRIDSAMTLVRTGMVSYLADMMAEMERQKVELSAQILEVENMLTGLPKTQRDILAMERKLAVNEKLAVYLLERKAATIIDRASITPEARMIETARYFGVVGPDKRRTIVTYTAVGLLIALAIGLIRMVFFERIESVTELKEVAEFPVLGSIPYFPTIDDDPIAVRADSRSAATEAFRSLRTNLQYLLAQEGANVILVSSLHPSEGKSFVAANLSSILAKAGKRVCLVDLDIHKPKTHKYMGLENTRGASSILVGRAQASEVKQRGPYPSLDVITAGPVPPNASDLILGDRLVSLVNELKHAYDYVILDTAPILLINDALVLMRHVDTGLLVMNVHLANRRGVEHMEGVLAQNGLKHASFVLNGIKPKRWMYYYSKYVSKYGYGYGYGGYGYGGYGGYGSRYGDEPEMDDNVS